MPADIDADLLRAFLAVVDQGGFTSAARALARTQSAVSMQVRRLEERTRQPLFARAGREVCLTAAGEVLAGYARRMLALNDEALATLGAGALAGTVRLGAMDDYATRILPAILATFAAREPAVRLEVQTGLTGRLLEQLGRGLDLVLAMHPAGVSRGQVVRREAALWVGPVGCRALAAAVLPLALAPPGCLFRAWALAALDGAGRRWRIVHESPSLGALEAAVGAGLAIGVGKAGTADGSLRRLGPSLGLPPLPEADIALHRAPGIAAPAARLAEHLAARSGPVSWRRWPELGIAQKLADQGTSQRRSSLKIMSVMRPSTPIVRMPSRITSVKRPRMALRIM